MRIIVLILLTVVNTHAVAEWTRAGASGNGTYEYFVDYTSIRRSGNTVKMWFLMDYKQIQERAGRRYLSSRNQAEYDCTGERSRSVYFTWHSANMGSGNTVYSDDGTPGNWIPVAPGSVGEGLWRIACGNPSQRQTTPASQADFDVVNRAAQSILQIRVSPIESDKWGDDKLPGVLRAGERFKVRLPDDGRCNYDVQVTYADLMTETRSAQNLCALTEMVFDGSSRRAAAAPKPPTSPPSKPATTQGQSYGTAFFVSPLGHALTNNHVAENCRSLVALLDGGALPAQIVRRDSQNDLALIRIQPNSAVPFASFRALPSIKAGEGVVVAGFPLSNILQNGLNITLGNVSALAGLAGNTSLLQITAPVQPGNSGGPLLDMAGNLVGVVVGKLDASRIAQVTGDIPQNVNFAVQGAVARLFLESGGLRVSEKSSDTEQRVGDVSDQARAFTFQIECRK